MPQKRQSLDNLDQNKTPDSTQPAPPASPPTQPTEQGKQEAVKETAKTGQLAQEKFDSVVSDSEKELYRTKSVSPLKLTYKEIIIDMNKVTVVDHPMPFTDNIHTIIIQDIKDIKVTSTPLLSAVSIMDNGPTPTTGDKLKKDDAMKVKRLIQGIILAQKQAIDLTKIQDDNLVEKIEKLGSTNI